MQISDYSRGMIVGFEVTSQAVYERLDSGVTWPGGASGATIGIGYDLGYRTAAEIRQDWSAHLSSTQLALLCSAAGKTAAAAQRLLPALHGIQVPFDAAIAVFDEVDIPRTIAQVIAAFPNTQMLGPDQAGALVSLVYNRGADCSNNDRRREMYQIREAMRVGDLASPPIYIRDMKRLWVGVPGMEGLVDRREDEAICWLRPKTATTTPAAARPPTVAPSPTTAAPARPPLTADDLNQQQLDSHRTGN
jgi:hypothetical protein